MNPKGQSYNLLGITRSRAKMFEYKVPKQFHLNLTKEPELLLSLTIGILGDYGKVSIDNVSEEIIEGNRERLLFSAQFFDSFFESKLQETYSKYYLIVGSAAYYLADLPGSASVLAYRIRSHSQKLDSEGLEDLLIWLLQNNFNNSVNFEDSAYLSFLEDIVTNLKLFHLEGNNEDIVLGTLNSLSEHVYSLGTDRQLLFADIIKSVVYKQLYNSSWNCLKRYSELDINQWRDTVSKTSFIREFWPAQKILGEKGVFRGKSAIVQMPTSAGKTKSIEIIIRSSFMSGRTNMAVIVAPFRALCSEIKNSLQIAFKDELVDINEPSDAMQPDFDFFEDFNFEISKMVLILTPEKLMYILRTTPSLSNDFGLLIYDEGHQFDNGIRGVTYELLLSSLKNKVAENAQIVLISAVISNAESIGNWLIEGDKQIISGQNLLPTYRTIAFASWQTQLGMLQFVKNDAPDELEYYVPRIFEQITLPLKARERTERRFPIKNDGNDISLYLAIKLIENGSLAIFCGSKLTVKSIYEKVLDLESRNYDVSGILKFSDNIEISKLVFLTSKHFGIESSLTKSARLGVFAHSGNTPEGLRLAIEYSMQSEKIKFIICTSTLAQGVNLPIRYLLIPSFYQAGQKIKIRDFHNLIGRAGRSGMHTEGSIIFTNIELYDNKNDETENWKWDQAKRLLNPNNSEPCNSTLLSIFDPLYSDDEKYSVAVSPLEFVEAYLESPEKVSQLPGDFARRHSDKRFTISGLSRQISYKIEIISSIESYLMAYWDDFDHTTDASIIDNITKETLAYSLSEDEQKQQLLELFRLLSKNVSEKITSSNKRVSFGRTLLGVQDILEVESWTLENIKNINNSDSFENLLENIWPILYQISNSKLKKIFPDKSALKLALLWIKGSSYFELLTNLKLETRIIAGTQLRKLNQEHIVDICQSTFAYGITLIIAAICEIIKLTEDDEFDELLDNLNLLQKMIKYGLPDPLAIAFYEIGFADRIIAIDLSMTFKYFSTKRSILTSQLIAAKSDVSTLLNKYPSYFENVLGIIVEK